MLFNIKYCIYFICTPTKSICRKITTKSHVSVLCHLVPSPRCSAQVYGPEVQTEPCEVVSLTKQCCPLSCVRQSLDSTGQLGKHRWQGTAPGF